jgi:hypothetical protein
VQYDTEKHLPVSWGKADNQDVLHLVSVWHSNPIPFQRLAIEMIASYGMAAGKSVFDTCVWVGRFIQAWGESHNRVLRRGRWGPGPDDTGAEAQFDGVCMTICRNSRAKDTNIRQAIIDRYGGKEAAIGRKAAPGPLYGMKADAWAALAVALTWAEHMGKGDQA